MGQTEPHFLSDRKKSFHQLRNIYKKQHGTWPCVEKMQFIFFVPPNEELEGTLLPQKFGCIPKNEGKRVHVPPDEKTWACWMVLFQNCVRQSRSSTKMATTVQLHCYWKQLWSRWAITGSWEPLVIKLFAWMCEDWHCPHM